MSRRPSLTIGVPTSGRPEAIEACLRSLDRNMAYPHERIVLDNTPDYNSDVPYESFDVSVLKPDAQIGPGESRQRLANAAETDLILFLDDDLIVESGTVQSLVDTLQNTPYQLASGRWHDQRTFTYWDNIGALYEWGERDGQEVLIDIPVEAEPLEIRGYSAVTLDSGLPSVMVDLDIFDTVSFDSRYDFFYEWADFYLQCSKEGYPVRCILDATFTHEDFSYEGETIRDDQRPETDRKRFVDKWNICLDRDATLGRLSWGVPETKPMKIWRLYRDKGWRGVLEVGTESIRNQLRRIS